MQYDNYNNGMPTPGYNMPPQPQQPLQSQEKLPKRALVLGVLSVVLANIVLGFLGLILGNIDVKKNRGNKLAKTGRTLGIIGMVWAVLFPVVLIFVFVGIDRSPVMHMGKASAYVCDLGMTDVKMLSCEKMKGGISGDSLYRKFLAHYTFSTAEAGTFDVYAYKAYWGFFSDLDWSFDDNHEEKQIAEYVNSHFEDYGFVAVESDRKEGESIHYEIIRIVKDEAELKQAADALEEMHNNAPSYSDNYNYIVGYPMIYIAHEDKNGSCYSTFWRTDKRRSYTDEWIQDLKSGKLYPGFTDPELDIWDKYEDATR